MISLTYVILHYKNYEDTCRCVESIEKLEENLKNKIIIVDNGSQDGTGEKLKNKYRNKENIHIILNESNLGFAKGLNIGIKYSKEYFINNFIVLLNSDTEIIGENWGEVITKKYQEYRFDVMGPEIVDLNGDNTSNPRPRQKYTLWHLNFKIIIKYIEYIMLFFKIDIIQIYIECKSKYLINRNKNILQENKKDILHVELQGSCLILSKSYLEKYDGLYDLTFLYFEEAILKYIADRDNLIMLYTPEIKILHKEYGSTEKIMSDNWERKKFQMYHGIKSRKILRNLILKDIVFRRKTR